MYNFSMSVCYYSTFKTFSVKAKNKNEAIIKGYVKATNFFNCKNSELLFINCRLN